MLASDMKKWYLATLTGFKIFNYISTTSPNGTTLVEVQETIHDTVTKAFDGLIKLNEIFVMVKENIHDALTVVS